MVIDAVIKNGQIHLLEPITFFNENLVVKIDIPDTEILSFRPEETTSGLSEHNCEYHGQAAKFHSLTDALFSNGYCYIAEKSDQEILTDILSEKYA